MLKQFCLILFICMPFLVAGQSGLSTKSKKAQALFVLAEEAYRKGKPDEAIVHLDEALKRDKKFLEAYLLKADIFFKTKQYAAEVKELEQVLAIDSAFFIPSYYNMGVAKYHLGDFDEVEYWMEAFKTKNKGRRTRLRPDDWVKRAVFAKEAVSHPVPINPINLGAEVNSTYDEYWPSITADGERLIFTVLVPRDTVRFKQQALPKNSVNFREDFYGSSAAHEQWQPREPLLSINTDSNEGAQALSADGNWMFFTACGRKDTKGSCDIYFSKRIPGGWSQPVNLGAPVNSPFWESQPTFSADGTTLYFISGRPGGVGNNDIWQASIVGFLKNGTPFFGDLKNLGKSVNSRGDESSPFIHHDGQTLYFSSNGWMGMGAMDLFLSRKDSAGQWQEPVNLGYPINSGSDETGLVINAKGDRAYFSSDGLGDKNNGKDIYMFELPEIIRPIPAAYVKGRIFDKESKQQLKARLKVKEIDSGELIAAVYSTEHSGEYLFCLPVGKDYGLTVRKPGYLFYSGYFDVADQNSVDNPQVIDIYLSKIKPGERIVLRNVFFETDSYMLKNESSGELQEVIDLLAQNKEMKVEIGGHTDNVGSHSYNQQLSQKRAKAVIDYLLSKGVNGDRLKFKGYGFSQPLESNETEAGRARNRRTEIKVIE